VPTKNRQTILLITALCGLGLLVADSVIYTPLANAWGKRAGQLKQLRQDVAKGKLMLSQRQRIEGHWDQMRTNTLPNDMSVAQSTLLKALEGWEKDSQVKIDRVTPQWKPGDDFTTLECRADASGSMNSLLKFLYDVEKGPLGLKIDSVDIASRDNDGQTLTLGIQLSGLILSPPQTQ